MPEHDVDKRHAPRFSARVRVLYFSKGQPRAGDADCQNISAEGLFVKTRRRGPDTGTPVSLILSFNDSEKEIMVDGIVRWQGEVQPLDDGTETAGMGIQFTDMNSTVRDTLEQNLQKLSPGANHS